MGFSFKGKVSNKFTKQSKRAKKNEPRKRVSLRYTPAFARLGPKIPPNIPPPTIKAVAL